ncbi:MAG: hypothetical protein K2H56_04310 [Malacoplasma sp.]|nr:hypothetical protein [Malacoplasma sp.]
MRNVLLYFAIKHNGDWEKIYDSISNKEMISDAICLETKNSIKKNWLTILDDNYPEELKKILKPPFILFYEGNVKLLNKSNLKISLLDDHISIKDFDKIKNNLNDFVFIIHYEKKEIIENLLNIGALVVAISKKGISEIDKESVYQELLKTKNLIISESYSANETDFTKTFYQDRLHSGLSGRILFFNKVSRNKTAILSLLNEENIPIFSLKDRCINGFKFIKVNSVKEFKKINFIN